MSVASHTSFRDLSIGCDGLLIGARLMIRARSARIAAMAAALSALPACYAHSQVDRTTERVAGCYALSWQPWTLGDARADSTWQTPDIERGVWLTVTSIVKRGTDHWFVVRPAPGEKAGPFGDVRWTWNDSAQQVVIEWDATIAGVRLELVPHDTTKALVEVLDGTARWWSTDATLPPTLSAKVRATRQGCTQDD